VPPVAVVVDPTATVVDERGRCLCATVRSRPAAATTAPRPAAAPRHEVRGKQRGEEGAGEALSRRRGGRGVGGEALTAEERERSGRRRIRRWGRAVAAVGGRMRWEGGRAALYR
jgi:hypothetical protein